MQFLSEGELLLKEGRVRDVEFSGPTYQVEVVDPASEESMWPFLQLGKKGELIDSFCSCDEENQGCPHLAAAYLKVFAGHPEPLHVRFEHSFWHALAQLLADRFGFEPKEIKELEGAEQYLKNRQKQTPENSLKFSNLSAEEITHWREGRPSLELRFELSFWADLAKWWQVLQDEGACRVSLEEEEGLPRKLSVTWKGGSLTCLLTPEELLRLIPTLPTVDLPLKVHAGTAIDQVTYDPVKRCIRIHQHQEVEEGNHAVEIGLWHYVTGDGFYPVDEKSLFVKSVIPASEIGAMLTLHADTFKRWLSIEETPKTIAYHLSFDQSWTLHLKPYLETLGDIEALYGEWVYLKEKKFCRVKGVLETDVVPADKVGSFVSHHRVWLNAQQGFHTHLATIETGLTYEVTPRGALTFQSRATEGEARDFGEWVYYEGEGFFSKKEARGGIAVHAGVSISEKEVGRFIKEHIEELETLPGFFIPLLVTWRGLELKADGQIKARPAYEPADLECRFFDGVVYVAGQGFSILPPLMRLPEGYEKEKKLTVEELVHLRPFIRSLDPKLTVPTRYTLEVRYLARNPEGGLKAQLVYRTEMGEVAVTEIAEAIEKKHAHLFSDAGLLDLHDERFAWIRGHQTGFFPESQTVALSTLDFLRLEVTQGITAPPETAPMAEVTRTLLSELRDLRVREQPNLKGLKSELRLYQQTGLQWLWFLYRNGLSGLLCDDMGLGKTHQAMALMAAAMNQEKGPFLVVCPTSVIYHWEDKLATFLPGIKVQTFHGLKRSLKKLPKEGVILTSYGILRLEKSKLSEIPFEIAVFDEIQVAKNPQSRIHEALIDIQAKMRLGLTGTPIENSLRELKALLDIALPGYMPGEARFRDQFTNPIEKEGDVEKRELLTRLIQPFVLRRRKQEVLAELPEKSEDKFYCDLSEEQAGLYQKVLDQNRDEVITNLRNQDISVPYIHIFSILANLKQVCNHPALIAKDPQNYKKYTSGKWDAFVELLQEARESEQKVVVFSQYLYMLDIMEHYVKEQGWGYAQIRGDTVDRREELRRFQEDPTCLIFIGSLQAAGLGIDLTAASIVIMYDRWWNAARENQAIDRVHRMGQKRGVQVFKLITKGTIEEKIDQMITRKGRLMEEVVTTDDQGSLKKFSRSELIELLSYEKH